MSDKPWLGSMSPQNVDSLIRRFRNRIRSLQAVDEMVARIVNRVSRMGELDNTLLVFTSDNGFLLGEHRRSGKTWPYENSIRVPLLIRGPGFPGGRTTTRLVANIDLAPTISRAAGVAPGRTMDGRALQDVAADPGVAAGRWLLISGVRRPDGKPKGPLHFLGVRSERYVYIRYEAGHQELYDLKVDPFQLTNVASNASYASIKEQMIHRYGSLVNCSGAGCSRGA